MNYKFLKNIAIASAIFASLSLSACSNDSSSEPNNNNEAPIFEGRVHGTTQKGPFVKGSTVTLFELDKDLHQTGAFFKTIINNDSSTYNFDSVSIKGPYAWMVVNGYYINEYTGKKSSKAITLNGLVELGDGKDININILSHLAFNRINYLVQEGASVADAQKQAEAEVLKAFNFTPDDKAFEKMNIFSDDEGDAKLLAISLIMLHNQNDYILDMNCINCEYPDEAGSVIEQMANISYDIETDGTWDDDTLKQKIKFHIGEAGNTGIYKHIRQNLLDMGATKIPNFEKYLKQFNPSDSIWGYCSNQDEIKKISASTLKICRSGEWKYYEGGRSEKDSPIDTTGKYGTFIDERDNQAYKTLDIKLKNGQIVTWMANILNLEISNDSCQICEIIPEIGREYLLKNILDIHDEADTNKIHEQLRSNDNFQGICPTGWHIPRKSEMDNLTEIINEDYQTRELLLYNQYIEINPGLDIYANLDLGYYAALTYTYFIDIDEINEMIYHNSKKYLIGRENAYSVRCVKD